MNIILTCDNSYCQHAAALIASICHHNQINTFYIVSDYISKENILKLQGLCTNNSAQLCLLRVDRNLMHTFPIGKGTANSYVSLATYYRLFIPELLPNNIDKIIYIDCDVIVNGSLEGLWNTQVNKDTCIVALEEMKNIESEAVKRLGYNNNTYFNAGVLLLFVDRLRKMNFTSKALQYINQHSNIIKFHDQDILNALLYNYKEFMPLKYNVMDTFLRENIILPERYRNESEDLYNPIVIHYTGPIKPWFVECNHPYKELYYHYLALTPWQNYIPVFKYNTFKQKSFYYVKSICKQILSITGIKKYSFRKDLTNSKELLH